MEACLSYGTGSSYSFFNCHCCNIWFCFPSFKLWERNGKNCDLYEASVIFDRSQALMIPVLSSCSLLMMFYLFSSVLQILTDFTAIASISSLYFVFSPYIAYFKSQFGLSDPFVPRCFSKSFTRIQAVLLFLCISTVVAWLVSGHWILNKLLGISLCVAFVSHVCLPNIKVCAMLLICNNPFLNIKSKRLD